MADLVENKLKKDLEVARNQYFEIYKQVLDAGLPGVLDVASVKCNGGAVCGGGEWVVASEVLMRSLSSTKL